MSRTGCPCDLAGLGVLVTRPAHQSVDLCRRIEQCGGRPSPFPALEIRPAPDPQHARTLLLQAWDTVIYTSANAVQYARDLSAAAPTSRHCAAVGQATAQALARLDRPPDLLPGQADSEGLLALEALRRVAGQRILIVRGQGGRPLLGDALSRRGARVRYAEVYRRARPRTDPTPVLRRWGRDVQAVTATSAEILENLWHMLGPAGREALRTTPLILVSPRMTPLAQRLGIRLTLCASGADDAALLTSLCTLLERPHDG